MSHDSLSEHYANYHRNHPIGRHVLQGRKSLQRSLDSHVREWNSLAGAIGDRSKVKFFPQEDHPQAFRTMLDQARYDPRTS